MINVSDKKEFIKNFLDKKDVIKVLSLHETSLRIVLGIKIQAIFESFNITDVTFNKNDTDNAVMETRSNWHLLFNVKMTHLQSNF